MEDEGADRKLEKKKIENQLLRGESAGGDPLRRSKMLRSEE
jgi:hypothetical protein